MTTLMKRRDFITLLSGAAAAWPLAARAQQPDRMRRIGVLMNLVADDPESLARVTAFAQGLQELGWTVDRNVRIDYRWGAGEADLIRRYVTELLALACICRPRFQLSLNAAKAGRQDAAALPFHRVIEDADRASFATNAVLHRYPAIFEYQLGHQ